MASLFFITKFQFKLWRLNTFFIFFILVISSGAASAQQDTSEVKYLRGFKNIFHLKVIGQYRPMTLRVQEKGTGESILFQPNARPMAGIGGEIVDIGFALTLKLPESAGRDNDIYGNTRFHDFQVNWYQDRFAVDFQYQYYQGFYISRVNIPDVSYDEYLQKPDLRIEGYGLNGVYVFNQDKFSYGAAFNNSYKQLRSTGSFLMMASIKHTGIRTAGTLIPDQFLNEFSSTPRIHNVWITGFSIMPGYAQTFVAGNFYLNLVLEVGPDLQYRDYVIAEGRKQNWRAEGKMNIRGGLGYDNGDFFAGVFYLGRRNRFSVGELNIVHEAGFARLNIGHRFSEMSWMQDIRGWKLYKKIMNPF